MGVPKVETLESRTLMSAVPLHTVKPPVKLIPARHAATIKTVNPAVTGPSITYKSFADDPLFASGGPTISDINQGDLGDCYLLATLSSVVNTDPGLIRKDIVSDGDGIYTVIFGGAKATRINVNADLPVEPGGQLAYAQLGNQDSIWVAVMEKAYVQYADPKADSYARIEGGWMTSAFAALGLSSQTLYPAPSATALLATLKTDLGNGDFVTIGTNPKLPAASPLVTDHAYEVDAVNVNSAGTPVSITLRNPWGDVAADDGYITVTAAEVFSGFSGVVVGET